MDRMEDSGSFGRSSILRGATKSGLYSWAALAPEKGGRERYRKPPVEVSVNSTKWGGPPGYRALTLYLLQIYLHH